MRLGTLIGAAAAAVAAAGIGRRLLAIRTVPAELRRPFLLLPLSITNRTVLRLLRTPGRFPAVRDDVRLAERAVPGAPHARAFVFEPEGGRTSRAALLWIHGGGYVIGEAAMDHALCARVAAELGILVVSAEYRLAPEHPFPAGLDDCFGILRWLSGAAEELGVDPDRIAVGGASAGGGLAAAAVQRAHDEGVPVAFQLLQYPMLDDRTVLRREHEGRGRFGWTPASNRFGWASYLGHDAVVDETRPYAAPGRRADLTGLPPAWIGIGELDLFYDEDLAYSHRLRAAGVPCEFVTVPGMYHGADAIAGDAPAMQRFRDGMVAAVRTGLGLTAVDRS